MPPEDGGPGHDGPGGRRTDFPRLFRAATVVGGQDDAPRFRRHRERPGETRTHGTPTRRPRSSGRALKSESCEALLSKYTIAKKCGFVKTDFPRQKLDGRRGACRRSGSGQTPDIPKRPLERTSRKKCPEKCPIIEHFWLRRLGKNFCAARELCRASEFASTRRRILAASRDSRRRSGRAFVASRDSRRRSGRAFVASRDSRSPGRGGSPGSRNPLRASPALCRVPEGAPARRRALPGPRNLLCTMAEPSPGPGARSRTTAVLLPGLGARSRTTAVLLPDPRDSLAHDDGALRGSRDSLRTPRRSSGPRNSLRTAAALLPGLGIRSARRRRSFRLG